MSRRDEFVAVVLPALLARSQTKFNTPPGIAAFAVQVADAVEAELQRRQPSVEEAVGRLLTYCMDDIGWDFDLLTSAERDIIGSPEMLAAIKERAR